MKNFKLIWLALIGVIVSFDQVAKFLVIKNIPLYSSVEIFSWLNIGHIKNTGIAFGMLSNYSYVITILVFLIISYLFVLLYSCQKKSILFSLSLLIGGALGNVVDRINLGHVVDFIDVHIGSWHWPYFNFADSFIVISVILYLYYDYRKMR